MQIICSIMTNADKESVTDKQSGLYKEKWVRKQNIKYCVVALEQEMDNEILMFPGLQCKYGCQSRGL